MKIKIIFLLIVLLSFVAIVHSRSGDDEDKQKKVDAEIVLKLKEQAKKAREEIKEIQDKIKPLKQWLKEHKQQWYPEQVFAKTILKTIKKKNKKIRNLLLDSIRKTHKKAELYRSTMGFDKKYLKHLFLYLYYLTTKESPDKEKYSKFIFTMAKKSDTLKKCVICYNLVRVLNFVSNDKYVEKLQNKLKKAANNRMDIIDGMKPVVKNLISTEDTFQDLYMTVKVVRSLKKSLKEKTLYYQKKVIRVKKISIYNRRIRNIRHIYYRMIGAENQREKEELTKQMRKFAKYTALKKKELLEQKKRTLTGLISLKKILHEINTKLETVTTLTFREYIAQRNHNKDSADEDED